MYCSEYEITNCGNKVCCYDCDNNSKCNKKCELDKTDCDCLRESEPKPIDERYTYRDI